MTGISIRLLSACLFASVVFFGAGCGKTTGSEDELKKDPQAAALFKKANVAASRAVALPVEDVEALKTLRERYPDSPTVRRYLITALVHRDDLPAAKDLILESGEDSLSDDDKRLLAKIHVQTGDFEEAIRRLTPLVDKNPNDLELRALAGLAYFRTGNLDRSAENLDAVWEEILANKAAPEIALRGIVYYRKNDLQKARDTLLKAVEIKPDLVTANNTLSQVYRALGDDAKAEEYRNKVLGTLDDISDKTLAASEVVSKKVRLEQAWKENKYQEVLAIAKELLEGEKDSREKMVLMEYIYNSYKKLGMEKEAEEVLRKARENSR